MFDCWTCSQEDMESKTSSACSNCHQIGCHGCLDDQGTCAPCSHGSFPGGPLAFGEL